MKWEKNSNGSEEEGKSSVWRLRTGNIGGIQCGRRPETWECTKPTVVHRSSGRDQLESEYQGHFPQVDICR